MHMKVTALKTFTGKAGLIRQGSRPDLDEDYVKELEREGLVSRHEVKPAAVPVTKAGQKAQDKAAAEQEALEQAKAEAQAKADEEAKAKALEEAQSKEDAAAKQEKGTK